MADIRHFSESLFYRRAHHALRKTARKRVHGHQSLQVVYLVRALERRVVELYAEAVFILNATVKKIFAATEFVCDVGLVEPYGSERIVALTAKRLYVGTAGVIVYFDVENLAFDENRVVVISVLNKRGFAHIHVNARVMPHEFFNGINIEFIEVLFALFRNEL